MCNIFEDFEKDVFMRTLEKNLYENNIDINQYNRYISQHKSVTITFINNGVGFYFDYSSPNQFSKVGNRKVIGGGNYISKSSNKTLVEILLFIENDNISCMEGHGYGDYIDSDFFYHYKKVEDE